VSPGEARAGPLEDGKGECEGREEVGTSASELAAGDEDGMGSLAGVSVSSTRTDGDGISVSTAELPSSGRDVSGAGSDVGVTSGGDGCGGVVVTPATLSGGGHVGPGVPPVPPG
jgi:hypothetical protein